MGGSEGYYYFTSKYEASLGKMKNGMHKDSILSLLGNPYREGKNIISFALVDYHIHEVDANNSRQHYEGLFLFFDRSMLFGILIKFPPGC